MPPASFLLLKATLWFQEGFRVVCCLSVKNGIGIVIGNISDL